MRFVKTAENLFGLPLGFTRVEYLQSSGTQYIDTGFVPTSDNFQFEIRMLSQNTSAYLGYRSVNSGTATGDMRWFFNYSDGRVAIRYGDGTENSTLTFNTQTTHKFYFNGSSLYVDDVNYLTTTKKYATPVYKSFYLFSVNVSGYYSTDIAKFVGRIYYAKIWDNNVLVRDFIPCIDPFGVPCMYDLVGKKVYYNQGTGTFTVGRQIIPVEYLEGTGTQCINTGISYFADYEVGIQLRENVANKALGNGSFNCMQRRNAANPIWQFMSNNTSWNSTTPITEYHVMKWKDGKIYSDDVFLQDKEKVLGTTDMYLYSAEGTNKYPNVIHFCKLWNPDNGELVRDYIPCKDENNVGFMFDKVSCTAYLNSGTGSFSFGENKYNMKLRLVKDNKLPAGYTQVEYLESSGTQYIDSDIYLNENTRFEAEIQRTGYPSSNLAIIGIGGDTRGKLSSFRWSSVGTDVTYYYNASQSVLFSNKNDTAKHLIIADQKEKYASIDNDIQTFSSTLSGKEYKFFLFGYSFLGVLNNDFAFIGRIYYFKIYDNGTLVRDFIPALDPSGTPCMYDLVTKTPFYNAGTGTFITGKPVLPKVRFIKDVIPREYAAVNYIESTGTQYIDTGIIGTEGVLSEIDVMKTTATTNECFLGTWNSGSARCWLAYAFSNKWYPGYGGTSSDMVPVIQNSWAHIKTYITQVNTRKYFGYNINGTDYTLTGYFTSFTGQNTILIFAMNTNTGANYKATGRIGVCKITKDGVLVRNFIPVVRRIDKVAGMWDTVTKQFFTTPVGAFNYG